jgi:hypothetical protein
VKKHCELLMTFKTKGFKLSTYMGKRWFVLKAILIVLAVIMLVSEESVSRGAGLVIVGYLIGIVAGDVRRYVRAKRLWQEVIDWEKVKEQLGEELEGGKRS